MPASAAALRSTRSKPAQRSAIILTPHAASFLITCWAVVVVGGRSAATPTVMLLLKVLLPPIALAQHAGGLSATQQRARQRRRHDTSSNSSKVTAQSRGAAAYLRVGDVIHKHDDDWRALRQRRGRRVQACLQVLFSMRGKGAGAAGARQLWRVCCAGGSCRRHCCCCCRHCPAASANTAQPLQPALASSKGQPAPPPPLLPLQPPCRATATPHCKYSQPHPQRLQAHSQRATLTSRKARLVKPLSSSGLRRYASTYGCSAA